jgi:AraC-like DNA-binding protein
MIPQISIIDIIQLNRERFSCKTENKSCYVLACRIEGKSSFFYNGEERLVKRGDVLYIPAGSSYFQTSEKETVVCFHLNILGQVSPNMETFSVKDKERMCELFVRAEQLWRQRPSNYEFMCMSILYEIVSNIRICTKSQLHRSAAFLKPAMKYLNANLFDAELSLEETCRAAHISRTYFNKLFGQVYGQTPTVYINRQRIERAKQLLLSGSCYNEEIAHLCGFKDVKYFYVIFKKMTGKTTKEYKRDFENSKA